MSGRWRDYLGDLFLYAVIVWTVVMLFWLFLALT